MKSESVSCFELNSTEVKKVILFFSTRIHKILLSLIERFAMFRNKNFGRQMVGRTSWIAVDNPYLQIIRGFFNFAKETFQEHLLKGVLT